MSSEADFTRWAQQYMDMVFRVAFGHLKNRADADDVTQTVFLRLLRAKRQPEDGAHVKHWLLRVTINESKRLLLAPWRRHVGLESCTEAFTLPATEHAEVLDAVLRLPPKYRTAIYLHYYEDCTAQEIAELLGIPRSTALTHLRRARELLKQELTEAET